MTRLRELDDGEDGWKRARDRKALRLAAERMARMDRERREELSRRLDEQGGVDDLEPLPRID